MLKHSGFGTIAIIDPPNLVDELRRRLGNEWTVKERDGAIEVYGRNGSRVMQVNQDNGTAIMPEEYAGRLLELMGDMIVEVGAADA